MNTEIPDATAEAVRRYAAAERGARQRLQALMDEPHVEELYIRGGSSMVVKFSNGEQQCRPSPFDTDNQLIFVCKRLAVAADERLLLEWDRHDPRLDIRVGDGWRLHAEAFVCSPPTLVLRSGFGGRRTLGDLRLCSQPLARVLVEAVAGDVRANVVLAAAVAGGKTALCRALLGQVPPDERIDIIEHTSEPGLSEYAIHANVTQRRPRGANNNGMEPVTMAMHVRAAQRSNISKLVVDGIAGDGTMALLEAMSSGLQGCMATLQSATGDRVLEDLLRCATSDGADEAQARLSIARAAPLLVWIARHPKTGKRVIADVTEVTGTYAAGTIGTRCLWRLAPGEHLAAPVAAPQGRMADVYRSAGVGPDHESQPDAKPPRQPPLRGDADD